MYFGCHLKFLSERSVSVKSCPSDITETVSTLRRTAQISWPDPVFLGPGDSMMSFICSAENNREFYFGVHSVTCFPEGLSRPECKFLINVTGYTQSIFYRIKFMLSSCNILNHRNICYAVKSISELFILSVFSGKYSMIYWFCPLRMAYLRG